VRYADDFVSTLSNAEKQIIPGAAHMLPQEQTAEVAEAIERFLEAQTTS
jgi:pimeloyl-ACP methyl ester carboxylesterase